MVPLFPLISFTTIYVCLGLLGSIASIWALIHALKRKRTRAARPDSDYERGFTVTFRTFKRHGR